MTPFPPACLMVSYLLYISDETFSRAETTPSFSTSSQLLASYPMSPPTARFSQLSLDKMPPTTRLQSRGQQQEGEEELRSGSEVESEFEDDDPSAVIVSPSKLTYSLNELDEDTRDTVIDTFCDPPQMALKAYASRGQYVVFQVAEMLPCWIQAGAEDSPLYAVPTCGCGSNERPCRHLIWLFDQLSSQMLTNEGQTLTMTREGYAAELGNPFSRISDFHIDMLADGLHCNPSSGPSPRRIQETREILASLNETPLDEYRPDLVDDSGGGGGNDNDNDDDNNNKEEDEDTTIIKRRDLEKTIFRMLLHNDDFFSYFLSSMPADELVNNRFRQLEQRVATAFAGLDAYAEDSASASASASASSAAAAAAAAAPQTSSSSSRPKNVEWCAAHLALALDQIYATIQHAQTPLSAYEQRAAARAVVRTLEGVVERAGRDAGSPTLPRAQRDLYFCLVGDRDHDFAMRVLNQLPPATLVPWVGRLGAIEDRILAHGAPPSYVKKLRSLLARVRSSSSTSSSSGSGLASSSSSSSTAAVAGSKRGNQGHDRGRAKRMK